MDIFSKLDYRLTSIRKFYFLEYFYILLYSVKKDGDLAKTFENFKILKEKYQLGESKYRLSAKIKSQENKLENRYTYTFYQVLEESMIYDLIYFEKGQKQFALTEKGNRLLNIYNEVDKEFFYFEIFKSIEDKTNGFNFLVDFCYKANPKRGGLLIFPIYSPLKLGFQKANIKSKTAILEYLDTLVQHLEYDIEKFLKKTITLKEANEKLIEKLIESNLIGLKGNNEFDLRNYNLVIKRIRDYWLGYFLKDIYSMNFSFSYFDIWSYRARYLGLINTTEFYPNFNGRIVYPVSIISKDINEIDFRKIYEYANGDKLFIHEPSWESFQDAFVQLVYDSYHDLKRSNRSYFLSLQDLREMVCYKAKISYDKFVEFLTLAYNLNLKDQLKIKISLEADKLPDETNALYLKREPILIDGKQRNIIAIDLKQ